MKKVKSSFLSVFGSSKQITNPEILFEVYCGFCKTENSSLAWTCVNCKASLQPDYLSKTNSSIK